MNLDLRVMPGAINRWRMRHLLNRLADWSENTTISNETYRAGVDLFKAGSVWYRGPGSKPGEQLFDVKGSVGNYTVSLRPRKYAANCTCPGGQHRPQIGCKHRIAAILKTARLIEAAYDALLLAQASQTKGAS